jgi:hypothetical protein
LRRNTATIVVLAVAGRQLLRDTHWKRIKKPDGVPASIWYGACRMRGAMNRASGAHAMKTLSRTLGCVVLGCLALCSAREASAVGGEKATKVAKRLGKALTRPIPLYPGSRIRFNVAPIVTEGTKQLVIGVAPLVRAADSTAIGVVALATGERSNAGGLFVGLAEKGSAAGGMVGWGGKHGAGLVVGLGDNGNGFGGVVGAGDKHGVGLPVGASDQGNAVALLAAMGGKRAFGVLGAYGDESAHAGLVAVGAKKNRSLGTLFVHLGKKLWKKLP